MDDAVANSDVNGAVDDMMTLGRMKMMIDMTMMMTLIMMMLLMMLMPMLMMIMLLQTFSSPSSASDDACRPASAALRSAREKHRKPAPSTRSRSPPFVVPTQLPRGPGPIHESCASCSLTKLSL
eukprot:9989093-Karenia_brevis.AAC.1